MNFKIDTDYLYWKYIFFINWICYFKFLKTIIIIIYNLLISKLTTLIFYKCKIDIII